MTTRDKAVKNSVEAGKKDSKSAEDAIRAVLAGRSNELTHDEMLRGQALSMACSYYTKTIVSDGDLYREMVRDNKVLKPATYQGVIEVALAFELFLAGQLREYASGVVEYNRPHQSEEPSEEPVTTPPAESE